MTGLEPVLSLLEEQALHHRLKNTKNNFSGFTKKVSSGNWLKGFLLGRSLRNPLG